MKVRSQRYEILRADPLRPNGRADYEDLEPSRETFMKYGLMMEPYFRAPKTYLFKNANNNTYFSGKIAIKDDGSVLPCVFARDNPLGNVNQSSLKEILDSQCTRILFRGGLQGL